MRALPKRFVNFRIVEQPLTGSTSDGMLTPGRLERRAELPEHWFNSCGVIFGLGL